jgi:hypothetical protein
VWHRGRGEGCGGMCCVEEVAGVCGSLRDAVRCSTPLPATGGAAAVGSARRRVFDF